jgi:hypothetical protein
MGTGEESGAAGLGASFASAPGGYLDNPIPQSQFRIRFDAETGINRFDRAQYLYGTWLEGSFHPHAFVNNGQVKGLFFDPTARGTQINSNAVNQNLLSGYLELAVNHRVSAFVEVPYQWVRFGGDIEDTPESAAERALFPEKGEVRNPNFTPDGVSDITAGFKYALIAEENCRYVTFQLRGYFPTGDNTQGIGTGHYSIEPSLLFYQRLSDRLVAQGQLTYWIPLGGGPSAGDVFEYGAGLGYDVIQRPNLRVTPVFELVGWTVIAGTEAMGAATVPAPTTIVNGVAAVNVNGVIVPSDHFFQSAAGDTIVNAKIGIRTYLGEHNDIYVGYGHALTGDRWYRDVFRIEYRLAF